jgi:hypothetical protein
LLNSVELNFDLSSKVFISSSTSQLAVARGIFPLDNEKPGPRERKELAEGLSKVEVHPGPEPRSPNSLETPPQLPEATLPSMAPTMPGRAQAAEGVGVGEGGPRGARRRGCG